MPHTNQTFVKFIAYLQVIGIVLVVFGHSFHMYGDGNGENTLLWDMLHSFRMPLFIFVSGYLLAFTTWHRASNSVTIGKFVKSKVKRLLVPFITLTAITFLPRCLMSGVADDPIELSLRNFFQAFIDCNAMPIPYYWFLHASFILLCSTFIIIKLFDRAGITRALCYSFLIITYWILGAFDWGLGSFLSLQYMSHIAVYFVLGIVYCDYSSKIDQILHLNHWSTGLLALTAWGVSFFLLYDTSFITLCSICGIIMCTCLAKLLVAHNITILEHLIGANYLIFLLSWFFNVGSQQILAHFVSLPWWIYSILSLTTGIYIPWLIYRCMVHYSSKPFVRVIAFLLGQSTTDKRKFLRPDSTPS